MQDNRTLETLMQRLQAPFSMAAIRQRPLVIRKDKSAAIPANYVDARAVMDRLDAVVGPFNWQSDFKEIKGAAYAGLGIRHPETGEWIWKWDAGSESNLEKAKGEASDALKRAAVKFGIGWHLYAIPDVWVQGYRCRDGRFRFHEAALKDYRERLNRWIQENQSAGRSKSTEAPVSNMDTPSAITDLSARIEDILDTPYFSEDRARWAALLVSAEDPDEQTELLETLMAEQNSREQAVLDFRKRLVNAQESFQQIGEEGKFQYQLRKRFETTSIEKVATYYWGQADACMEGLLAVYQQQKDAA